MTRPMRDSGSVELGFVPTDWVVTGISRFARLVGGAGFPLDDQGIDGDKVAFYKVNALGRADQDGVIRAAWDTISIETASRLRAPLLPPGTIILAKIGAALQLGRIRRTDRLSTIDNNMLAVVPSAGVDPTFLTYALQTFDFAPLANPGAVPSLDMRAFRQRPVCFPPRREQRAIADYLDWETAQIDAFIAKNAELIALLTERRAAEISRSISGDWSEVQLRTLSTVPIQNGVDAVGDPSNPPEWPRYVRTTDIANVSSLDPEKRVTIAPDQAAAGELEMDDILLTRAGATIGKSYLHSSGEVASYAGYLVRVRPDRRRVLPWYLAYWTQAPEYLDQIRSGAVVSTIENFNASKYRALRVPLPPLEVQAEIVGQIRQSSEHADHAIAMATNAIDLARERRSALISAAVTGKIDVGVAT